MRIKINDTCIYRKFTYEPSDLYRKFMPCFDFLLTPENNSAEYIKHCYVPCALDDTLKSIYESRIDSIYKLMGYTGIGKTTMICKNFGLNPNKNIPVINNNSLVMPVFFDADSPQENDINGKLVRKIKSACKLIKDTFSIKQTKETYDKNMYHFINKTKDELLNFEQGNQRFIYDSSFSDFISNSLDSLYHSNMLAYYLCELKMYLNFTEIDNIIIVLDDLESQSIDTIMYIISEYYHIFECLKNNDYRKYKIKLLISSRPHTLRFLNNKESYKRHLDAYGVAKELSIESPPDIIKIFHKRFRYATLVTSLRGELLVKDINSWKNALTVLETITQKIDLDFGKILYNINHYNIRETLSCFVEILCNRKWLQKNQTIEPSFIIKDEDFNTSKSAVLKSLIYGNNNIYVNNDRVPNVLYTDVDTSCELFSLLIIKYFIKRKAVANYGVENVISSQFLENCNKLWNSPEIIDIFILCINNLIKQKILLYSVYEKEYEDKSIETNDERKLYLSSKGYAIWEMLTNDSVLFEAYREDVYRDHTYVVFNQYNIDLQQEEVLIDCLCFLESIVKKEINIKNMFFNDNKESLYNRLFGTTLVSQHIFNGISNTINYYFRAHNRELSEDLEETYDRVKNALSHAHDID